MLEARKQKIFYLQSRKSTKQLRTRSKDQVLVVFTNLLIFWHEFSRLDMKYFKFN